MFNRPLNAVLTRLAIVAAVLATLMLLAPAASAQQVVNLMEVTYAENDTVPVGTYLAVDPEGEAVTYSVSDEETFAITEDGGVLTFNSPPDFEDMEEHKVYVLGNDAMLLEVTITITNMEEGATVTVGPPRPQVGRMADASVEDMDGGETDQMWTWQRSADMTDWEEIEGADAAIYEPTSADVDMYLRATVSYLDNAKGEDDAATEDVDESRDTASGVSELKVEASPNANAAPEFSPDVDHDEDDQTDNIYQITIDENSTGAIGEEPITATDADNDVRLYTLDEGTGARDDNAARFEIGERSGQISVTDKTVLNAFDDTDIPDGNNAASYDVTVTATDPSGATGTATVRIVIDDVDEAPVLTEGNATELTIGEADSSDSTVDPAALANAVVTENLDYGATDNDQADNGVDWSVSDEDNFEIDDQGVLTFTGTTPDYEKQNEYKVTITAVGDRDPASTAKSTLDVTVKVSNVDETGSVLMTARQPQVGKSVTASVIDPDGDVSSVGWTWAREAENAVGTPCPEAGDPVEDNDWDAIADAKSASYTPADADIGKCLQATAIYTDPVKAEDDDRIPARGVSDAAAEMRPADNAAPEFTDEEMPDGADPVEIEVKENSEGNIGDANVAGDDDTDLLLYTLGGADADSFDIVERGSDQGQISVGDDTMLDYEGQQVYNVTVIATDPSGASDTVDVTITLKDEDEAPEAPEGVTNAKEVDYAENDDVAVGTYLAVDPEGEDVTYGVSDDDNFAITEDGGVLTFVKPPDFEDTPSHTVTVTANDADLIEVTITITNMEEGAEVTVEPPQPQVGRAAKASVEDMDGGEMDKMWQWSRSSDMMEWEDIDGAIMADYTPQSADVDMYLRASVSYIDDAKPDDDDSTADVDESMTRDEASGISEEMVEASPDANAAPMFDAGDDGVDHDTNPATADAFEITIDENSTGEIGGAIAATDADPDVLLYSLGADADADNGKFTINDRTGQISVGGETDLDYEIPHRNRGRR